jgi:hypothetical protein
MSEPGWLIKYKRLVIIMIAPIILLSTTLGGIILPIEYDVKITPDKGPLYASDPLPELERLYVYNYEIDLPKNETLNIEIQIYDKNMDKVFSARKENVSNNVSFSINPAKFSKKPTLGNYGYRIVDVTKPERPRVLVNEPNGMEIAVIFKNEAYERNKDKSCNYYVEVQASNDFANPPDGLNISIIYKNPGNASFKVLDAKRKYIKSNEAIMNITWENQPRFDRLEFVIDQSIKQLKENSNVSE